MRCRIAVFFAYAQMYQNLNLSYGWNVGGWKFKTTLINLCSEKGLVLRRMLPYGFSISRDSDGAVFIDRNDE